MGKEKRAASTPIWRSPKIRGTLLGVPINKDSSILGSLLGSPYFGKLPFLGIEVIEET